MRFADFNASRVVRIREVWLVDFEFRAPDGERPDPLCMVAREFFSGAVIKVWRDELLAMTEPPFNIGSDAVFVAFYASAELGCFQALGWPRPANILDLYIEHRLAMNRTELKGNRQRKGASLLAALAKRGLPHIDVIDKEDMRERISNWFPFTPEEQQSITSYCDSDVIGLYHLFGHMQNKIDWPRALLRGRYMWAAAAMEWAGIPIDPVLWPLLKTNWKFFRRHLIEAVDKRYGVFDGTTLKYQRLRDWARDNHIDWPLTPTGKPKTDEDTLKELSVTHPKLGAFKELMATLNLFKLGVKLAVGSDSRARCLLSGFGAASSRNAPSGRKFPFNAAVWIRGLIQAQPGWVICYLDWSAQEFAIAAVLSGDPQMLADYASGDPHLLFAKIAGLAPTWATKDTHEDEREQCKSLNLGVLYGMGAKTMAARLGVSLAKAQHLLNLHRRRYPVFWRWSEQVVISARARGSISTRFGWRMRITPVGTDQSIMNYPMQANAAEMMRLAAIAAVEAGIHVVCFPGPCSSGADRERHRPDDGYHAAGGPSRDWGEHPSVGKNVAAP